MKLKNPLLVVRDMERSKTFYREVLGLHVVMDFGANVQSLYPTELPARTALP